MAEEKVGGSRRFETEAAPTKPYRLRDGFQHRQDGRNVQSGEVVELTEVQARAFGDKFLPVDAPPEPVPSDRIPQANDGVPQDIGAKTPNLGGLRETDANIVKATGDDNKLTPAGEQALGVGEAGKEAAKNKDKNSAGSDKA